MYHGSAQYYDQLYQFKDYAGAARGLCALAKQLVPHARTLLDVACGTGRHLEHPRTHYEVEGLDINSALLEHARVRCPGIPLHCLNMTAFELGRTFDIVTCLFSAIAYVKTSENLRRTVANLALHTAPGGLVLLEPYFTPEQYRVDQVTMNVSDQAQAKIAWMYISRKEGNVGIQDTHFLVGTPTGIEYFCEHHELGLFSEAEYAAAFVEAGLDVEYDPKGLFGRGMYIGRQRAASVPPVRRSHVPTDTGL
jgi:SAM-dependent methyltransferase